MKTYRLVSLSNQPTYFIHAESDEGAVRLALDTGKPVNVFREVATTWSLLAQVFPDQPAGNRVFWMAGRNLDRKILAQYAKDSA